MDEHAAANAAVRAHHAICEATGRYLLAMVHLGRLRAGLRSKDKAAFDVRVGLGNGCERERLSVLSDGELAALVTVARNGTHVLKDAASLCRLEPEVRAKVLAKLAGAP
jgi:hypothetical protein